MTKRLGNLHKILFSLLILLLPVQLGKHFWPSWAMVNGLRIDYLSPALYLTDILIVGILVSWVVNLATSPQRVRSSIFLFSFFFIFLFLNCFLAQNQPAAFYKLIKILEFSLLGLYVVKNFLVSKYLSILISVPIIYSSLLAIAQFINQGSLGGVFYWLGERTFDAGTPGIALADFNGQLVLRSYATFPHPNVLAGFLVINLLWLIFPRRPQGEFIGKTIYWLAIVLGVVALFLTFSHVAWAVFAVVILFKFLKSPRLPKLLKAIIVVVSLSTFYYLLTTFPVQSESFFQRQDLNIAAVNMIRSSPLLGVGLNNFLIELPKYYSGSGQIRLLQPVHNIFLLAAAEAGIIIFIIIIIFIALTIRRLILTTLIVVLVLGLFDHYFLTLQSGQILLTLVLGLSWCKINSCPPKPLPTIPSPK